MISRILHIVIYLLVIISCASPVAVKDSKLMFVEEDSFKYTGLSKINIDTEDLLFSNSYIFALPDYRNYQDFNNYFQIGVFSAIKHFGINNKIEFINQNEINTKRANKNFLIGPINKKIVSQMDGLLAVDRALMLNEAQENYYLALNTEPQINALINYLEEEKIERVGIISGLSGGGDGEELFKKSWFSEDRDAITIDASYDSENRIENFLDVSESKQRFNRIDAASFAKVNFVPRSRDDFNQIIIFPENSNELYKLSSLVRFNYGLNYEIISLTSDLQAPLDPNEIKLHDIKLIDHTYLNKYRFDLAKSRSFSLGFDSMMIAYAISNKLEGKFKGYLATYELKDGRIKASSYFN